MLRLEEEVRLNYGKKRRSYVSVVREHYLRDDIPCKVDGCCICENIQTEDTKGILGSNHSHFAIPDVPTLSNYLEVFEQPGITGCILLQTALTHVRNKMGRKAYHRAKTLLSSPNKDFIVFSNENQFETFAKRGKNESIEEWHERLVYTASSWYVGHLQVSNISGVPIVIVSAHPENYSRFNPEQTDGLLVLDIEDYLKDFWPVLKDTHKLLQSLIDIRDSMAAGEVGTPIAGFSHYLPQNTIEEKTKRGLLYTGRLKVNGYHPRDEAFVTPQHLSDVKKFASDIFIQGTTNRNRAIHGDVVAVKLLPCAEWRSLNNALPFEETENKNEIVYRGDVMPTGMVVGIVERVERLYVASFDESSDGHRLKTGKVLVCPYDIRIPRVRITTRQAEALKDHRIVIRIDLWEVNSQYPNGHFVRDIGPIGRIETETAVILIEHQLSVTPFSKGLLKELSCDESWKVDETEVVKKRRRDLRHTHLVMSIDPKGCEDVDDALSVRYLDRDELELGVHIADVSHFVSTGSLADCEAKERSTTVYLADRRYDMLPPILSANLCSLLSSVDRYAVSVMWHLDKDYQVKSVWYGRTVIQSRYKLAYETAQALFDGERCEDILNEIPELQIDSLSLEDKKQKIEELRAMIKSLVNIARILRERRGGLELEGVEVRVEINDKDRTKVEDLIPKQPLEMHETIAECMIFANHWVAKKIQSSYPTRALLRHHPPPSQDRLTGLIECAKKKSFTIDTRSNKTLAVSLDRSVDPNDPEFNRILRYLATQAMVQAQYFSSGSLSPDQHHHYGLDLDLYTHFTSPIRRYADLVVHRQLLAAVEDQSTDPNLLPTNSQLQEMAQHMNKKHRSAQLAQLASVVLFQGLYFSASCDGESDKQAEERHVIDGIVIGLRSNGMIVFSPRYGIRAPVYLRDKYGLVAQPEADKVVFGSGTLSQSEKDITVYHLNGQYTIGLFDHVRVHVTSTISHAHGHHLSLQLLSCGSVPPSTPNVSEGMKQRDDRRKNTNRELVKLVQKEIGHQEMEDQLMFPLESEYRQSDSDKNLYCIVQRMRKLALQHV